MTFTPPPCPADLSLLTEPAIFGTLGTLEVGAVYRLVVYAWSQADACVVPDDNMSLAAVAGCSDEEWARIGRRVLLALGATQAPRSGYLTLEKPRSVFADLAAKCTRARAQRTEASHARWRRTHPPPGGPPGGSTRMRLGCESDPGRMRVGSGPDAGRMRAESERTESERTTSSESALSLQRSNHEVQNQSAQKEVIAVLGDGARALRNLLRREWTREQVLRLLHKAWPVWERAGYTDAPITKATELAAADSATPPRVEHILDNAAAMIARYEAGDRTGRRPNPVGLLIAQLGLARSRPQAPIDVPLVLAQKWARLEESRARLEAAQAAINAKRQTAAAPGTAPSAGTGAG